MVENRNNKRIIHAAIALLIALILIFADSASAITVKVDTTNMPTVVGKTGYFYFNVTIGGNEKIPIANFTIEDLPAISGSPGGKLVFNVNDIGTTVGDDKTIGNYKIELVNIYGWVGSSNDSLGYTNNYGYDKSFAGYGYGYAFSGYGYGYGNSTDGYTQIAYKITVDTTGATADTYDVIGKINTGVSSKPSFSTASTSSFTLKAEESTSSSSSRRSSNYWKYHGTPTPTSTESENATQVSPTKTEKGDVGAVEQTQAAATPVKTDDGGIPGFTAIMFIAGLLTAAYIIIRKRG